MSWFCVYHILFRVLQCYHLILGLWETWDENSASLIRNYAYACPLIFPSDPWMIELIIFFWSIIFISRKTHHSSYNQSCVTQIYPRFTSFGEPSHGLPLQMVFQWKFTSRDNGFKRQTLGFRFLRIAPSLSQEMSACNARIYMFQGQIRIWVIWGY